MDELSEHETKTICLTVIKLVVNVACLNFITVKGMSLSPYFLEYVVWGADKILLLA